MLAKGVSYLKGFTDLKFNSLKQYTKCGRGNEPKGSENHHRYRWMSMWQDAGHGCGSNEMEEKK